MLKNTDVFPFKVELHVHLDGAMRLPTILDCARSRGVQLPSTTLAGLKENVLVTSPYSLNRALAAFQIFMPAIAGGRDAISRIAYEFVEDCAAQNIRYVEARYSPHLFSNSTPKPVYAPEPGSLTPREVVVVICDAFEKASRDFNVNVKSILCCIRGFPDWCIEVADLCRHFRSRGVVGIDIAGPEFLSEKSIAECSFKQAYRMMSDSGIHRTAHAGEACPSAIIREALDELEAERLGHGYTSLQDARMYDRIRQDNVHLEVCPSSSIMTGGAPGGKEEHPLLQFAQDGVNFSINTDDPRVFDVTLSDEYQLSEEMGLSIDQIIQSIFNSAKSCFAPEAEKKAILARLEQYYGTPLGTRHSGI